MTIQLSPNFTYEEAVFSSTAARLGLDNTPSADVLSTMKATASKMEVVRSLLNCPIRVDSWYRSLALNAAIGSKPTSQHIVGEAVDFLAPQFGSPIEICHKLQEYVDIVLYDQLILEHNWVHISFAINPSRPPRKQVLSLLAGNKYAEGLTDVLGKPV